VPVLGISSLGSRSGRTTSSIAAYWEKDVNKIPSVWMDKWGKGCKYGQMSGIKRQRKLHRRSSY
jgi:hypothetical protein